jgi:23S rRNA (uracil1939-C5)-methyltransferase
MLRVRPERFVAGGEAISRDDDGRVVFVRGGIPGDDVSVDITETHGDWQRGRVVAVHEPSPDRIEPPCEQRRAGCGGCDWQHVRLESQLPGKVAIVVDALRRTAKLDDAEVRATGSVPPFGYRTTIRVVGDERRRAAFRMERTNATVPAAGCLVAHPDLVVLLDELVVPAELELTLRVSASSGEATASWDPRQGQPEGLPGHVAVGPDAMLHEQVGGHRFRVSAASFFQSGPAAAELLVETVRAAAPELHGAGRVLDAYGGVGLFAVAATEPGSEVIVVESSRSAVADARVNLASRRAKVERREFGRWRPERGQSIDVAIADPARTGLGKPGVATIAAVRPPVLVLVSCDPVALARDTALLRQIGYRHDGTDVLDVFPQTHHVEAVTRLVLAD